MTETFDLKFSLSLPNEREEAAVEAFGELLRRIEVTDDYPESTISVDDVPALVNAIDIQRDFRRPTKELRPIKELPPIEVVRPIEFSPVADNTLYVRPDQIQAVLDAMFRVWVTEVRPRILNEQTGPNATPADQSVLLARLTVTVNEGWQTNTVTVHEEERPYLLHTRLIQEYLLNREQSRDHDQLLGLDLDDHKQYLLVNPEDRSLIADLNADGHKVVNLRAAEYDGEAVPFEQAVKVDDAAGGDVGGTFRNQLKVKGIMGRTILDTAPQPGAYLVFNGDAWEPKAAPPGVTEHAKLKGLDQDDHKQYLLANGGRALGGNLDANQKRIINLSQSVANGDPIVRGEAAAGDLSGNYPAPTVTKLQGNAVDPAKPASAGLVLTWDGAKWTSNPFSLLNPVATQLPSLPFVSIARIPTLQGMGGAFRLWFHPDPGVPKLGTVPVLAPDFPVKVYGETLDASGAPRLVEVPSAPVKEEPGLFNVFNLELYGTETPIVNYRFAFPMKALKLRDGTPLLDYYSQRNLKYLGHDGLETIIAFWSAQTGVDLSLPQPVASGAVDEKGQVLYGNFTCELTYDPITGTQSNYLIRFPGWRQEARYVVTGIPINTGRMETLPVVTYVDNPNLGLPGIVVQLRRTDTRQPVPGPFMVQVAELLQRQ
jgi:hypothetical protein